jgi:hypothetical protein
VVGPVEPGPADEQPPPPQDGPDNVTELPDLDLLNDAQRCVWDGLSSLGRLQVARTGQLADLTGMRVPAVSKALTVLAELGFARKLAHGEWVSATQAPPDAVSSENNGTDDADDEEQVG